MRALRRARAATTGRAHWLAVAGPVFLAVALTPVMAGAQEPTGAPGERPGPEAPETTDEELLARGQELYLTGCVSCHGEDGGGRRDGPDGQLRGPSLRNAGEAGAYYYLATGRMPLANSEDQPHRNEPAYNEGEIDALVAYVASLGDGPALPEVDVAAGDLAAGGEIYRQNCQQCHQASGSGGALSYGRAAPNLHPADPLEIAAAVRIGPNQMPVFGPEAISDAELDDLIRYVQYLDDPEDPGGVPIGRTGPIPEGFVAWLVGMVALLVLTSWIGTRAAIRRKGHT
jgi:ubiquinol-cytochrome c reductase cytochrome c subunit